MRRGVLTHTSTTDCRRCVSQQRKHRRACREQNNTQVKKNVLYDSHKNHPPPEYRLPSTQSFKPNGKQSYSSVTRDNPRIRIGQAKGLLRAFEKYVNARSIAPFPLRWCPALFCCGSNLLSALGLKLKCNEAADHLVDQGSRVR